MIWCLQLWVQRIRNWPQTNQTRPAEQRNRQSCCYIQSASQPNQQAPTSQSFIQPTTTNCISSCLAVALSMTTNEQQTQLLLLLEAIGRRERANLKTMIWCCVRLPLYLLNACLPIKHVVTVVYAPLMFVSIVVSTRPRTKSKDEAKAPLLKMRGSLPLSTHPFYSSNWLWLLGKPTTNKWQSVSQKAHNFWIYVGLSGIGICV